MKLEPPPLSMSFILNLIYPCMLPSFQPTKPMITEAHDTEDPLTGTMK